MTTLSLRDAAEQTGVSKSTIFRAIKAGRMSAAKTADGNFAIDPAELFRVYQPVGMVAEERAAPVVPGQDATNSETAVKLAVMEMELQSLREMVIELRNARDGWQQQTERMTLALSGPTVDRPWWKRLVG